LVLERCLEPDDKPADIMIQWEKLEKKKAEECVFLFKKKIFLKDDDREMEDLVAKDLIYKQVCLAFSRCCYRCLSLQMEACSSDRIVCWFGLVWSHY
jgi:hypothetical protein